MMRLLMGLLLLGRAAEEAAANPFGCAPGAYRPDVQLTAGRVHTCAVLNDSSVRCWGQNWDGMLGLGDTLERGGRSSDMGANLPAMDLGPGRIAVQLSAGEYHTCALLDNGSVKCWGSNAFGQLGLGDTQRRGIFPNETGVHLPAVDLGPGATAIHVSAGTYHTCAVLVDLSIKCWGKNGVGQLGMGNTTSVGGAPHQMGASLPAVDLGPGQAAMSVAACNDFTCAILDDGTAKCWGLNDRGQLGIGSETVNRGDDPGEMGSNLSSVELGAGRRVFSISAGEAHACALLDNGSAKCWGYNNQGQLGQGDTTWRGDGFGEVLGADMVFDRQESFDMGSFLPAIDLGANRTVTQLTAGYSHACALLDDGTVKCWGSNAYGELGQDDQDSRGDASGEMGANLPAVNLGLGRTAIGIFARGHHSCAVLDTADIKCWGYNTDGQLGLGDLANRGVTPSIQETTQMGDRLPSIDLAGRGAATNLAMCATCNEGHEFEDSSQRVCGECKSGTFKATLGHWCSACTPHTISARASTSREMCLCVAGYLGNPGAGGTCVKCLTDTYKPEAGPGECLPCASATASIPGSSVCSCAPGFRLERCLEGQRCTDDECVACGLDNYKPEIGDFACRACPERKASLFASPVCVCAPGFTPPPGEALGCDACARATFKPLLGPEVCLACPRGTSSPAQSVSLQDCNCAAGQEGGSDGVACTPCAPWYFKPTGAGRCTRCPWHQTSLAASGVCFCVDGYRTEATLEEGAFTCLTDNKPSRVVFTILIAEMRKIKFEETEVETFKATVATALGIHVEDIVQGPTVVAQYDARRALETPAREEHGRPPPAWGASFAKSFLGLLVGFPDCLRALRLLALRFLDVHREGSPGRGAMSRVTRGSLGPPPGGVGGGGLPPSGISSAQAAARPHHRLIGAKVAGLREVAAGGAKVAGMREVAAGGVQRRLEVPGSMLVELTAILPFDTTAMIDELFASKEFLAALNASGFSVLETNVISIDAADHTLLIVGLCCALPPLLALLVCWRQVARGYAVRTKARGDAVAPFGGSALALHLGESAPYEADASGHFQASSKSQPPSKSHPQNPGDDDHFRLGGPSSAKPRTEISGGATPGGPRVKSLRPSYTGTTPAAEIERDGGGSPVVPSGRNKSRYAPTRPTPAASSPTASPTTRSPSKVAWTHSDYSQHPESGYGVLQPRRKEKASPATPVQVLKATPAQARIAPGRDKGWKDIVK